MLIASSQVRCHSVVYTPINLHPRALNFEGMRGRGEGRRGEGDGGLEGKQ